MYDFVTYLKLTFNVTYKKILNVEFYYVKLKAILYLNWEIYFNVVTCGTLFW